MTFSEVEFFFFFPLVLLAYWLLPRRAAAQNAFLLVASYVFYASWNPKLVGILALSTAVDYFVGLALERNRAAAEAANGEQARRRMRFALGVSLVYNIGQLCFFKYTGFFAESLNQLLSAVGLGARLPVLKFLLPLGISFYTFQKLSYVIDVYYGRLEACRSPLTFATFVAFFPQLIAGPIVRGSDLLPQLAAPRTLSVEQVRAGGGIFLLGFFKKAFVADYLAQFLVDPIFADPARYATGMRWAALLGYATQLYCDFCGYSEMAIGCARLLGIELPANFNYPFLSRNLVDFWRRWHITLNTWLFDYVYGPLVTGEGRMRGRVDLGFFAVFILSGLWHGAWWTFVAWGVMHAVGMVVTRRWDVYYRGLCRKDRKYVALRKSRAYVLGAWLLTQLFFLFTLLPFRAPSLGGAGHFFALLFSPSHGGLTHPENARVAFSANLALISVLFIGYHALELEPLRRVRDRFFALPAFVRGITYGVAVVYLFLFAPVAPGTFIYAQF